MANFAEPISNPIDDATIEELREICSVLELVEDGEIDDLEAMTKSELELLGREHGVELDRRKSKKSLIETMRGILPK